MGHRLQAFQSPPGPQAGRYPPWIQFDRALSTAVDVSIPARPAGRALRQMVDELPDWWAYVVSIPARPAGRALHHGHQLGYGLCPLRVSIPARPAGRALPIARAAVTITPS